MLVDVLLQLLRALLVSVAATAGLCVAYTWVPPFAAAVDRWVLFPLMARMHRGAWADDPRYDAWTRPPPPGDDAEAPALIPRDGGDVPTARRRPPPQQRRGKR